MKKYIFSPILLALYVCAAAQDMRVYHGAGGQSAWFKPGEDERSSHWSDSSVLIRPYGDNVEIVVLNPNPFFYSYELKLEDFEVKDDMPDITDLLDAVNALPDIAGKAGTGSKVFPMVRPAGGTTPTDLETYNEMLHTLSDEINMIRKAILQSDNPEGKADALTGNTSGRGFSGVQATITLQSHATGHFNSPTLKDDLDKALEKAATDASITQNITDLNDADKAVEMYKTAFGLLNAQLASIVDQIKKLSSSDVVLHYFVPVTDKNQKVRLIVKKKTDAASGKRMEFDKLLCVIIPEYRRQILELVPLVSLTYAANTITYGAENGVITQNPGDGFKFRAGAMLLYNFAHFGKYREGAVGAGLGYSIPQKGVLENFQIGTMISYKQLFRLGVGAGFSPYPSGLKNGLKAGDPRPASAGNLEELVTYDRKLSFFINFSFSGITILKK